MTHVCCPACRLRLPPASEVSAEECPDCGGPLERRPAASLVGFHLAVTADAQPSLRAAVLAALARRGPDPGRS
jgi:hypothetical protein